MAEKPICIITPEGMKCQSSPLVKHFPGARACEFADPPDRFLAAGTAVEAAVKKALGAAVSSRGNPVISRDNQKVIARVVKLLVECQFDLTGAFTIVKQA